MGGRPGGVHRLKVQAGAACRPALGPPAPPAATAQVAPAPARAVAAADSSSFSATIPASAYGPGALVRWAVEAEGASSRREARDPRLDDKGPKYYGVVVPDPADAASLPVIDL